MNRPTTSWSKRQLLAVLVVFAAAILLPQTAAAITVSGTAMRNEVGTTWQGCASMTQNIELKVVGSAAPVATTSCDPVTGLFSFSGVTIPSAGTTIAIWFAHPTARGVLYTQAASTSADIAGLTPTQDRVWIRSEQPADSIGIDALGWDSDDASDVPLSDSVNPQDPWYVPDSMELHIDDGVTVVQPNATLVTGSIHVSPGATYSPFTWRTTTIRAPGEGGCALGPGVSVPICIEPTGTWTAGVGTVDYEVPSGRYAITPLVLHDLNIAGGASSLGVLGTAAGQTFTLGESLLMSSSVTSDPWAPNINVPVIRLSLSPTESWTGNGAFTLNASRALTGEGVIDLPQATVNLRGTQPKMEFGPSVNSGSGLPGSEASWTFRSVFLSNGGYDNQEFGTAGSGPTFDAGAGDERIVAVASTSDGNFQLIALPTGAGGSSWGIRKFGLTGATSNNWDDSDSNPNDQILVWDSPGADVPTSMIAASDGTLLVGGSSGGSTMVRAYTTGAFDTPGALNTSWFLDAGNPDMTPGTYSWTNGQVNAMSWTATKDDSQRLVVATTTGNTWDIHVVKPSDWTVTKLTWNGGSQARVGSVCADAGHGGQVFVVGSVGAAGSRNWGARRLNDTLDGWDTFNGSAAWTWDAGGSEDMATSCAVVDDRLVIAGTRGNGANDDWRVRGFLGDGTVDPSYATNGTFSYNGAGDDDLHAMVADEGIWEGSWYVSSQGPGNVIVAGTDGVTGQMVLRRLDHDGQLDAAWGTGGTIAGGAGTQSARALEWMGDGRLLVGIRDAANGGQSFVRMYDYSGQLQSAVAPGTIRVAGWGGLKGGTIHTTYMFQIGGLETGADPSGYNTLLDAESGDMSLVQDGVFKLTMRGGLSASSTAPWIVKNDAQFNGQLVPNTSTLQLLGGAFRSILQVAASNIQFHNIRIVADTTMIAFDNVDPIKVNGVFYVRGGSCGSPVQMRSEIPGDPWELDLSGGGSVDVQFAAMTDSTKLGAGVVTATNSMDQGNNTNWSVGGCATPYLNAPNGLYTNGGYHAQNVNTTTFTMAWYNRSATPVDRADTEVYSSPLTNQLGLWRFNNDPSDASGSGRSLTASGGVSYIAGRHGQAASMTAASNGLTGGDWDLADDFTIDGWFRTDLSTADPMPDLIYKGAGATVNYQLSFDKSSGINNATLYAHVSGAGGTQDAEINYPATALIDDQWHYVAMTFRDGTLRLYLDGAQVESATIAAQVPDTDASSLLLGYKLGGKLDDWRMSSVAYGADAIRGFYMTGRPHADEVWDFYPADDTDTGGVGTAIPGGPFGGNTRPPITYAGPALNANGARYWARTRLRSTASGSPANTWSPWSEFDWFETGQSTTVSLTTGPTLALGRVVPGEDLVGSATFQVTSDNAHGYSAFVSGPSDSWGMSDGIGGATHEIPGRGSPAALQAWPANTSGYFGLSVLSATGGKDAVRWGAGTTTGDLGTLNWGSPWKSRQLLLHSRGTYDPTMQSIETAIRVNAALDQDPGTYTTTLTFTAIPNV